MKMMQKILSIRKRVISLVLCAAMLIGLLPPFRPTASAAPSEQDNALNSLVSWGIMRGDTDGQLHPERHITRAEFTSLLNRVFGYTRTGSQPFADVLPQDWFFEDISIAHTAGYFQGTSSSTAEPNHTVTREQAATLLCRNLMLQPIAGENLSFSDSHLASSWSRGYIRAAVEKGILRGDDTGTFRPLHNITRGEVAIMLTRVIGTPIRDPGTYTNSVSGNMMISTSGVTLENLTVTGDLYITGGVGLGHVALNNVKVFGRIIASGGGESNQGDCSIILKNCSAPEMIVDSLSNQYVTIRTVGNTDIQRVYVRTHTYIEGKSTGRHGFQYIEVDGEPGTRLDLAGNIHEVVTVTPESSITVGSGTVEKMTIDEHATDSTVRIDQGAVVEELNLDTATRVTGEGDIGILNVNAPGCIVDMLPDIIVIRPGITATINGIVMDSTLAQQYSDVPRILAGYPRMADVAPNTAAVEFQTNKPGTLYWAIRLSGDGALTADELISPPTYGSKIIRSGNLAVSNANTTLRQALSGLTIDTSYIVCAVLVDGRQDRSLVKSVYFTTPDNSIPAFASGYPKLDVVEDTYATFDVAPTKTCTLHWAVYKRGMPAPTANDFKDDSLSGSIDSGKRRVERSEEDSIFMGNEIANASNALEELTDYDAYFFLTDGINESSVIRVQFTTADRTPPEFLPHYPMITGVTNNTITGDIATNENTTIYWAVVAHGTPYPVRNPSLEQDPEASALDQKLQIRNGLYALSRGQTNATANNAARFTLTGLEPETAYDAYFVAVDSSGNYSDIKQLKNAKTYDATAPELISQEFSMLGPDQQSPLASTDITLVFSEDIYDSSTNMSLVELFQSDEASFSRVDAVGGTITWEDLFTNMFQLKNLSLPQQNQNVDLRGYLGVDRKNGNLLVRLNTDGQTEVIFRNPAPLYPLGLQNGTRYQFVINNVTDASNNLVREIKPDDFRILDAQVNFDESNIYQITPSDVSDASINDTITLDASFTMIPFNQITDNTPDDRVYDVLIASDTTIKFALFERSRNSDDELWAKVQNQSDSSGNFEINMSSDTDWIRCSLNLARNPQKNPQKFPLLRDMEENGYEYAIQLIEINGVDNASLWNATINLSVYCITASTNGMLTYLNSAADSQTFEAQLQDKRISSIGNPSPYPIQIVRSNLSAPQFQASYPRAVVGDTSVQIQYSLDRAGTLFYLIAPKGGINDRLPPVFNTYALGDNNDTHPDKTYANGANPSADIESVKGGVVKNLSVADNYRNFPSGERNHHITSPISTSIINPTSFSTSDGYRHGSHRYPGQGQVTLTVDDLMPNQEYYVYFSLRGSYPQPSSVMCYQFSTGDVYTPRLSVHNDGISNAYYRVNTVSEVPSMDIETIWQLYVDSNSLPSILTKKLVASSTTSGYEKGDIIWEDEIPEGVTGTETVRELLLRSNTNPNRFDMVASDSARQEVWRDLLVGGSSGQLVVHSGENAHENVQTEQTTRNLVAEEKLLRGNNYILIVGAINSAGGLPTIQAVTGIRKADALGPQISSIHTALGPGGSADAFTGSITITFDDVLYVEEKGVDNKVYEYNAQTKDVDVTPNVKGAVTLGINLSGGLVISVTKPIVDGSMFTIVPYAKANGGGNAPDTSIQFGNFNPLFCNEFGVNRPDTIRLYLHKNTEASGGWICTLQDGTTSETNPTQS